MKSDRIHTSIQRSLKETIETLNHHVQDLQTDKNRLQHDLHQASQRIDLLQQENIQQRQLNEQLDQDRTLALSSCQHFQQTNEQLIHDHDQLQKLYTKLEQEFDTTINQLSDQRTSHRLLTKEYKYLQLEFETLVKEKQTLMNRVSYLLKEIHQFECQLADHQPLDEQYRLLQKQYQMRTEDLQETLNVNQTLKKQCDQIKSELNQTRTDLSTIQLQYNTINTDYANLIAKYEVRLGLA